MSKKMEIMKSTHIVAIGLASLFFAIDAFDASNAFAQQQGDMAGARAMYDRAIAAREKGLWEIACPSFAESHRLFPLPGTVFELADCEEKAGKISSAFNHYHQYLLEVDLLPQAKMALHADRVKRAEAALSALREEIPTLAVVLPASAPADIVIMRDSITLAPASLDVPMPVDPGKHVVKALSKDGRILFQREVVSKRKEAIKVDVDISTAPPAPPPMPPPPPPPQPPIMVNTENGLLRTGGYLAVGVGLTGLMTGSIMGALSLANMYDADAACTSTPCADPSVQKGMMLGNFSTVAFGVGIAGLAAGTTLLVVDHVKRGKRKENRDSVGMSFDIGPTGVSVQVQGVFQ